MDANLKAEITELVKKLIQEDKVTTALYNIGYRTPEQIEAEEYAHQFCKEHRDDVIAEILEERELEQI